MITVTQILGTDSLTASRPIINDNFSILTDEINALEAFIDPDAGTIDGLNSFQAGSIIIGPVATPFLTIATGGNISITTPISISSNIQSTGLILNDSFGELNSSSSPTPTIIPTSGFSNYRILHSSTGTYTIAVGDGSFGQNITFYCQELNGGDIIITPDTGTDFASGNISMNAAGSTVTLRYMEDSTGNGSWYVISDFDVSYVS
jgi:hypothetical protein